MNDSTIQQSGHGADLEPKTAVSELCPSCGLCCNGVLFGDVELQPGDDPARLKELGLALEKQRKKLRFSQPCACYDGKLCGIYSERPSRCRSFNCGLVIRVQSGALTVSGALITIQKARRQAAAIRDLLARLGQTNELLPLSRRCAKAIAQPMDLERAPEMIDLRGQLLLAVHKLTSLLQNEFLP